jgi:hypothetical protein
MPKKEAYLEELRPIPDCRSSKTLHIPTRTACLDVFNVDQLFLTANIALPGQVPDPPPPVLVEQMPEYEVAEFLDCRRKGRGFQYLVRWTGYNDPIHEPAHTIYEDVHDLAQNFHRRYKDKPLPPFVRLLREEWCHGQAVAPPGSRADRVAPKAIER